MPSPALKPQTYLIAVNGQQTGPYTIAELQEFLHEGKLSPAALVWSEGMPNWVPAHTLPDLAASTPSGLHSIPPALPQSVPPMMATPGASPVGRDETLGNIALALPVAAGVLALILRRTVSAQGIVGLVVFSTAIVIAIESSRFGAGQPSDLSPKGKRREGPAAWLFGTWLLWIACYPMWFHRRAAYGAKKRVGLSIAIMVALIFCLGLSNIYSGKGLLSQESPEVSMVKLGHLSACPNETVEQAVDSFFGSPKWESGVGQNGKTFVNISGQMTYMDKPVNAVMQFAINGDSFNYQAFEMNGIPQSDLIAVAVIGKMCGN